MTCKSTKEDLHPAGDSFVTSTPIGSAAGLLPVRRPTPAEMAFGKGADDAVRLVAMWIGQHPGHASRALKAFIREARTGALQPVV